MLVFAGLKSFNLRDRGRTHRRKRIGVAEIIGTRTYGKGVVQSVFPLGDGSAAKITTARYLTPHGRDINSIGIEPQIVSELPKNTRVKFGDPSTDTQLSAAITYLQSRIAEGALSVLPRRS